MMLHPRLVHRRPSDVGARKIVGEKCVKELVEDRPASRLAILIDQNALSGRGRAIFFKAAATISPDEVNVMATHGRGIISAAMRPERAYALQLYPMRKLSLDRAASTYFTSVEAAQCTETGISTSERALTLNTLGDRSSSSEDLVTPGHIMPAVISREAPGALELVSLALDYELQTSGADAIAWCDILDEQGDVACTAFCAELAGRVGCPILILRGTAVIEAEALALSRELPNLKVGVTGLDLGQFA